MSDIFPDRNIVDEINSNRGSSAEQKIQYRIMQALESIAGSLNEYMHPPVPKMSIQAPIAAPEGWAEPSVSAPEEGVVSMNVPEVSEGRRRRRQESA